jgi:hypothetical protein
MTFTQKKMTNVTLGDPLVPDKINKFNPGSVLDESRLMKRYSNLFGTNPRLPAYQRS